MASAVASSRRLIRVALAVSLCLPAASIHARSQAPAATTVTTQAPEVRLDKPVQDPGSRATAIHGTAWRADNTPIPHAMLRLRNVVTGKIEATTVADGAGRFTFSSIPHGTYLVELVSDDGKVLAVGQVFTVNPGETVATFVRFAPKVPWFNGFFGNAALIVAAGAATAGVLALAPDTVTAVSPNR